MSHLVSTLQDAAVSPEAWPQVLEALTDAAGAALITFNKRTGNVDEACFSGLSARLFSLEMTGDRRLSVCRSAGIPQADDISWLGDANRTPGDENDPACLD
jgi:hypothetical protein